MNGPITRHQPDRWGLQLPLFEADSPAAEWDHNVSHRALDELFSVALQYRSTQEYFDLMKFVASFRWYSPYNAMLVHAQMRGASFVAPAHRWFNEYRRTIRPGAQPLVILQPMVR